MGKFINIHTHLSNVGHIEVFNHFIQNNWNPKPDRLYSVGIHPWYFKDFDTDKMLVKLKSLADHPNVLAIGECGLDRAIDTPFKIQEDVFLKQVEIAELTNKPLIIHSVRSYSDLLRIRKSRKSNIPWILHGYSGNIQMTKQLLSYNFHFSFGAALLINKQEQIDSLQLIPLNKLFFETDESSESIETIYTFAAQQLNYSIEKLKAEVYSNFKMVFSYE